MLMKTFKPCWIFVILLLSWSCRRVPVSHWFPTTPQEVYEQLLFKEKIEKTQAAQTWFQSSKKALTDTLFTNLPYQERLFLNDSLPAQSVRFKIPEGRQLVITTQRNDKDSLAELFVELYRIKPNGKPQRLDYMKEGETVLTITDPEPDSLLVKVQTGVSQTLSVILSFSTLPSLSFPVAGYGMQNLISFWGAERDGGGRSHEGVDIKAWRGTPVIAGTNGFITQSGTNNLGGKVIFLSASDAPYSLYYAHLDSQLVSFGKNVLHGDTLGLVGNTGNAITTTPHLHFGIYSRNTGAVNPLPFIDNRKKKINNVPARAKRPAEVVRLKTRTTLYATTDFSTTEKIRVLQKNELLQILGELAKGYRVSLSDGTKGYIASNAFEPVKNAFSSNK